MIKEVWRQGKEGKGKTGNLLGSRQLNANQVYIWVFTVETALDNCIAPNKIKTTKNSKRKMVALTFSQEEIPLCQETSLAENNLRPAFCRASAPANEPSQLNSISFAWIPGEIRLDLWERLK